MMFPVYDPKDLTKEQLLKLLGITEDHRIIDIGDKRGAVVVNWVELEKLQEFKPNPNLFMEQTERDKRRLDLEGTFFSDYASSSTTSTPLEDMKKALEDLQNQPWYRGEPV